MCGVLGRARDITSSSAGLTRFHLILISNSCHKECLIVIKLESLSLIVHISQLSKFIYVRFFYSYGRKLGNVCFEKFPGKNCLDAALWEVYWAQVLE